MEPNEKRPTKNGLDEGKDQRTESSSRKSLHFLTMLEMDNERPLNSSVRLLTKKELEKVKNKMVCPGPPLPTKSRRSISENPKKLGAVPINFYVQRNLNVLYDETKNLAYFDQIYEKIEDLGKGSFGYVIKVSRKEDFKQFAIKVLEKGCPGFKDRHNEVQNLEKIGKHKNLILYYEAWEEYETLFIVMELCEISLSAYAIDNHNISENEIWDILYDMLKGLKYLHNRGLIHADIKPDNIMIASNGIYKLCDFGMLIDLVEFKKKKSIQPLLLSEGDPKYLAPETLEGRFTKLCDIFSLGITLLELCTDIVLPGNGPLWQNLRKDVIPVELNAVSDNLKTIIMQMMNSCYLKRPGARKLVNKKSIKSVIERHKKCGRTNYLLQWKTENISAVDVDTENDDTLPFEVNLNLPLIQCGMSNSSMINPDSEPKTPPRQFSSVRLFRT